MKNLTVLLSIFCMLHVQLPQAYADDEPTPDDRVEDARTVIELDDDFQEYTEDKTQIIIQTITLMVMMITAPIFAATCVKSPDVWIHLIGALLLLVMEGVLWGMYKQAGTVELQILEGSQEEYSTQMGVMMAAMTQTQKAKKWMDMRFGMVVAATVITGISMAIALIWLKLLCHGVRRRPLRQVALPTMTL